MSAAGGWGDPPVPRDLVEAWSRAEMSRREIGDRLGREVRFGELLAGVHALGLPLPRVASDPDSPGRRALAEILARGG